jgi:hypothetical protein
VSGNVELSVYQARCRLRVYTLQNVSGIRFKSIAESTEKFVCLVAEHAFAEKKEWSYSCSFSIKNGVQDYGMAIRSTQDRSPSQDVVQTALSHALLRAAAALSCRRHVMLGTPQGVFRG